MILKLQIDSTGTHVLIYNKDGTVESMGENAELVKALNPQELPAKYFIEGRVDDQGVHINLDNIIPPEQWPDW